MSSEKYCCPNIGCELEFVHRMQCWRHEQKCTKPAPEKQVKKHIYNITPDNRFQCFDCNVV